MIILLADGYRINHREGGRFVVEPSNVPKCPDCGADMWRYGYRKRAAGGWRGFYFIFVQRCYCPRCERIHHALPEGLIPYKRFPADSIEAALALDDSSAQLDVACETTTLASWRKWFDLRKKLFVRAFESLRSDEDWGLGSTLEPVDRHDAGWLARLIRVAVNTHGYRKNQSQPA